MFSNCSNLKDVSLPDTIISIGDEAFFECGLTSVIVEGDTPAELGYHVFYHTNDDMVIYVPAAAIEDYKQAAGWVEYAKQLRPYDKLPEPENMQVTLWGDANCDGSIDVSDAVLLARFCTEDSTAAITDQGKQNADVNQDGNIELDDVTAILRKIAKLD